LTQAVPPSRRREHDARSLHPHVADEDEGILNEDAHGVLRVGHVCLQRAPGGDGFFEGAAADPVARVLGADDERVVPPGDGASVRELYGGAGRQGVVQQAAVGAEKVDVELLRLERAHEGVGADRPVLVEHAADVDDALMQLGPEEVPGREVRGPIPAEDVLGERARLHDAVVAVLVGDGRVEAALAEAELGEHA
jgi:hypothetical protein